MPAWIEDCVVRVCTISAHVCVLEVLNVQVRERRLRKEIEKGWQQEREGLGGPGHRWLVEADVPVELFRVVPASSEMVTEVRRANRLPQNGWLDLGKQMLKNAFRARKCHEEHYNTGKQRSPFRIVWSFFIFLSRPQHSHKKRKIQICDAIELPELFVFWVVQHFN